MPEAESIAPNEHSDTADRGATLATIHDYADLQRALRERADSLDLARTEIDRLARLPSGYAAKVLAPNPMKRMGNTSMPFLLAALGVRLELVEDAQSMAEIARKATRREVVVPVRAYSWGKAGKRLVSKRWVKKIAREGGRARARKLSKKALREQGRHAAVIRWRDVKAAAAGSNGSSAARPAVPVSQPATSGTTRP